MTQSPNTPVEADLTPRLLIDLDALARNYARLQAASGAARTGAAVKADAYGLGAAAIAAQLSKAGCREFFVATPEEGAQVRAAIGLTGDSIFVLNGFWLAKRRLYDEAALIPVLNTAEEIAAASQWGGPCSLHVDTGMNRLGLPQGAYNAMAANGALDGLDLRLVMSHLACADEPGHAMNALQQERFDAVRARLPDTPASLANSAGILLGSGYLHDLTRPGIGLYGCAPGQGAHPFEPVVRIEAPILQLRELAPGDTVGYGASFTADAPMLAATIPVGYADGLLRAASNQGEVEVRGRAARILGRVSMDLTVIDVTGLRGEVRPGDRASLLGDQLDALAANAGTLGYELLTRLGSRFRRHYRSG
ncbi:MAG: alanine racemase [Pseudomonadota bacterium]